MSDIIYTPPVSSGGTTINPTDNFIPVRSNATTFVDSNLYNVANTSLYSQNFGFNIDYASSIIQLGEYVENTNGTILSIDDTNQFIKTFNQGNNIGLKLDFATKLYSFGDFNSVSSGASFYIDEANSAIYTQHSGQQEGLIFDFVNDYFSIGDFGNTNNGTYITIDDDNQFIASYTNGNLKGLRLDFPNEQFSLGDYNALSNGNYIIVDNTISNEVVICANKQLYIKGGAIQVGGGFGYANQNLQVKAPDGNIYYIPLYN
jgi:hypothetical protein